MDRQEGVKREEIKQQMQKLTLHALKPEQRQETGAGREAGSQLSQSWWGAEGWGAKGWGQSGATTSFLL